MFLTEDSYLGNADPLSLNLYTYCRNNPLIYIDPDGHKDVAVRASNESQGNKVTYTAGTKGNSTIKITTSSGSSKSSSSSSDSKRNNSSASNSNNDSLQVINQILNPLSSISGNLRELRNSEHPISSMGVKATNDISSSVVNNMIYPDGTLRRYIQIGGGTMEQDWNDKTLYHANVGGTQVDYIFKGGILYDKKTNAIVGKPNKQGYIEVSGAYYNNAFAGGVNQAFGGSRNDIRNIGGVTYIVTVQNGKVQYANGGNLANVSKSTGQVKATNISNSNTKNLPSSLPTTGEPNSTKHLYNPDGSIKQTRDMGQIVKQLKILITTMVAMRSFHISIYGIGIKEYPDNQLNQ